MATTQLRGSAPAAVTTAGSPQWDIDAILLALSDASRRRLLLAIAKNGPQTAQKLVVGKSHQLSRTLKQLACLCDAGLVVRQENREDGRKQLYALSPAVPLTQTETGVFMDFGFFTLRI